MHGLFVFFELHDDGPVDRAPVISLEYHNTTQAAKEPHTMLPEAIALVDILPQLAVYENGTKIMAKS